MITIEKTCRLLNNFKVGFTEKAVLRNLQNGQLIKAPRIENGYYPRNTKYGYSVDRGSLVRFLLERGVTENEINQALQE